VTERADRSKQDLSQNLGPTKTGKETVRQPREVRLTQAGKRKEERRKAAKGTRNWNCAQGVKNSLRLP